MPHGSVCSSMICCRSSLSRSRSDSSASRSALPSTERSVVCAICDVALTRVLDLDDRRVRVDDAEPTAARAWLWGSCPAG